MMNNLHADLQENDLPTPLPDPTEHMTQDQIRDTVEREDIVDWFSCAGGHEDVRDFLAECDWAHWPAPMLRKFEDWFMAHRAEQRAAAQEEAA